MIKMDKSTDQKKGIHEEQIGKSRVELKLLPEILKILQIFFPETSRLSPESCKYSRTSIARTPLEPRKYVRDRGSSS